jgi:hypothetical protein
VPIRKPGKKWQNQSHSTYSNFTLFYLAIWLIIPSLTLPKTLFIPVSSQRFAVCSRQLSQNEFITNILMCRLDFTLVLNQ